jgi:hypothetical protein
MALVQGLTLGRELIIWTGEIKNPDVSKIL